MPCQVKVAVGVYVLLQAVFDEDRHVCQEDLQACTGTYWRFSQAT